MDFSSIFDQITSIFGKVLGWSLAFILPIQPVLMAIIFLVGVDLITGILAAYKRGEIITSNGIRRTITKTLGYMLVIICARVMDVYFLEGIIDSVKIVSGLIAVTEFQSLVENMGSVLNLDIWKAILNKIHGKKIEPIKRLKRKK